MPPERNQSQGCPLCNERTSRHSTMTVVRSSGSTSNGGKPTLASTWQPCRRVSHPAMPCRCSTVTGSTAYSLSAGGPILSPEIEGFVVTPLNPLSLSARPLIVSNKKVIEVNVLKIPSGLKSRIILDGNQEITLENSNLSLSVRSADRKFKLVHPKGYDFYQICRSKLNWSLNKEPEN